MDVMIHSEYIKLQQAMQLCGASDSGAAAKHEILEGKVTVNGMPENRRGRKLYEGDSFAYCGEVYRIMVQ